jgi:hypothetical protein
MKEPMKRFTSPLILALLLAFSATALEGQSHPIRVVNQSSVTTTGSVAAGAYKVVFYFGASFTGSITPVNNGVNGIALSFTSADLPLTYEDPAGGRLPKFNYAVGAGTLNIVETR